MNVSIIIATYGEEIWSELAHERALPTAQAEDALEVLIGHDPDGTIAGVRNALASNASGKWLCFLDADDELAPGYLQAMERADRGPGYLLTPSVQQIRNQRETAPFFFPECSLETGNWLIVGTLVERTLFHEVGGFGEFPHGLEDWVMWAKCVKAGAQIVKVPEAIYRAHYNKSSKHHQLARNRRQYMRFYEEARVSVWG
jgi:glycosyltransferase involved in cell wall biosynthesis